MLIKKLLHPYLAPAGEADAGGGADFGDDFEPTGADAKKGATDEPTDDEKKLVLGDDESEEDPKADDEDEEKKDEDEKKPKGKDSRIPLKRHKEIIERERAARAKLEEELQRYKQGQQVAAINEDITEAENELLKMEQQYAKLLGEGELDKASELMAKIRKAERGIVQKQATMEIQAAEARAAERVRYDMTLERVEAAFPQLNPDHDDYDQAKYDEVLDLHQSFLARGYPPSKALQRAVKYVLGEPETKAQERAVESEARVDKDDVAKKVAADRAAAQRKKNAEVAGKQPPSTARVGSDNNDAKAVDVMKLSQADFAKLDEKELARLRGDEL
jgi:hypothetical protein